MSLFRPMRVGPVTVAGRLLRSATSEEACDEDGRPTPALRDILVALARGGTPRINTGYAYVMENGKSSPAQNGLHSDELVPGWRTATEAVHDAAPDCRLFVQLMHGGRQIEPRFVAEPVGPSAVPIVGTDIRPREMTSREIAEMIEAFGQAARRAREAGFDGIQIHCAHGYLVSQFLSPYCNRRSDEWGGAPERRRRFMLETLDRVRESAGPDLAVTVKLNCEDFHPEGLALAESCEAARSLAEKGIDGIEVSGWIRDGDERHSPSRIGDPAPTQEGYYLSQAREIKKAAGTVPVGVCGGFRSRKAIEAALDVDGLDFVALSRPFIAEPDLADRFRAGQERATCISCNQCARPLACPLVEDGKLRRPPFEPPEAGAS